MFMGESLWQKVRLCNQKRVLRAFWRLKSLLINILPLTSGTAKICCPINGKLVIPIDRVGKVSLRMAESPRLNPRFLSSILNNVPKSNYRAFITRATFEEVLDLVALSR